ncbi:MAG: TonB-dependent receptor [Ignavibacteria bacterium]|nr:TonB-dependent receptor [Ignavibacteria bacterium]
MRSLRLIAGLIILPMHLTAQGVDVRGIVTDSISTERIPFTNIVLIGTNRGAASNINGFYLIPNVPPGEYEISASAVGYDKRIVKIRVAGRDPIVVNFTLVSKAVEIPEIVVTERGKRELSEINTSIHVMDQREMRAVPVTIQEDVFRAIQVIPGIVTTSDVNSHFYVRGGGGDQNLILLDGMKIYNPYHAFGIFSIFDPDIIRNTEVYTGAFPPGFGGRLSSVVNLSTRDGRKIGFAGRANVNFLSTKMQVEGPLFENFQFLLSGRKLVFPRTLDRLIGKNTPLDFYDGFIKLTRQTKEGARFGLQGFFSGDDLKSALADEPDYRWRTQAAGFTASGLIQDRIFIQAVGYQNDFEAQRHPKGSKSITPTSTRVSELGVRCDATLYTDSRDLFFFGFEFSFPRMEYDVVNTFGIVRRLRSTLVESWVWLRYQAHLDDLKIDGGVHTDVGSVFTRSAGLEVFQPRLNVSYLLFDGWRGKLSYGRFSQNAVTVNNEDDVISVFDAWIPVPEDLDTEQADHYVAGIEGNVTRSLSANVQAYYKSYSSLVTYNRDKIDALDPDYINSTGRSYGFEALLRFGTDIVDLYLAYTLGWTSIEANGFRYPPRHDRRHNFNFLSVFHVTPDLDISLRWEVGSGFPFKKTIGYYDRLRLGDVFEGRYAGETGSPYSMLGAKNAARLPSYHRLDASATYRFSLYDVTGAVGAHIVNLYDHQNIFYFERKTGRQINMLPFFPSVSLSLEL